MTVDIVITRPLSLSENFLRSRTRAGFYKNFQVTATYSQDLSADLSLIYKALRKTIIDYHILICNVHKDLDIGNCIYRPISNVTLGDLFSLETAESNLEGETINEGFMKKVNKITFNHYDGSPLFRLILVGKYNLCAVFEHTIADGVVGEYFHEILLENLAYVDDAKNLSNFEERYGNLPHEIDLDSEIFVFNKDVRCLKNSLPPPIDTFLPNTKLDHASHELKYFGETIAENYPTKWRGRFLSNKDYSLSFKLINFTPEQMKEILVKCRQEKVTVTSYIEIVNALTWQPLFGDLNYTSHAVALTLRRHLNPELSENVFKDILSRKDYKILGSMAHTGIAENLPPITEFSWDLVRQVSRNMLKTTSYKYILNSLSAFESVADKIENNEHFFDVQLGKTKGDSVKISNLGYVNLSTFNIDKKVWTISNMIFSQDLSPSASEFMINIISTPLGGLNIVLSYIDSDFSDSQYDSFDDFVVHLKENMMQYIK
ncbi:hypothetical protein NADFUDRAFT_80872 [Nadsonia fulvescens var. elongata DSM 6958]|uniref:Alcohol acetyltransferase n=1 Tax=Nadsonia fulvescens var. elongata DSM 6958 TaxID=857566 RepID=A0A1E3PQH6_9ASCO|nr:hypothetical protein NADFUDRAFT_80872 [Nadsonia fulvescens var. elongata DSM 6958]